MGKNLSRNCLKVSINLGILGLLNLMVVSQSAIAQETSSRSACPQKLADLAPKMLADLPSYTNRVVQRSIINHTQNLLVRNYVIIASNPELEPLPLINRQFIPAFPDTSQQLFFTLLERQYATQRAIELQNHYWAFFDLTDQQWRLILLFSQSSSWDKNEPFGLTQESENSAIAQAINLWLRDCNAGAIKFPIAEKNSEKTNLDPANLEPESSP
jgi:hypothetical protein